MPDEFEKFTEPLLDETLKSCARVLMSRLPLSWERCSLEERIERLRREIQRLRSALSRDDKETDPLA